MSRTLNFAFWILSLFMMAGSGAACESEIPEPPAERVDFSQIESPVIFRGDSETAYRDPAVLYHQGRFFLFFTVCRLEEGTAYWYLGHSRSSDLLHWEEPQLLTPRDRSLNYSSPGNVIRYRDEWVLCLQTYPTPNNEPYGTADSRIWVMRSEDLVEWSEPELLRVKGPAVPRASMGRMIDPYLLNDKDVPAKWWCFYKQNGVSLSWSLDLEKWTYAGSYDSGENVCVLIQDSEYVLFHSPQNGIGVKRSRDLDSWSKGAELITLGQSNWSWAQGRLTAATVIDLRHVEGIARYLMFFHGSEKTGLKIHPAHGRASLAFAWSQDLVNWEWANSSR